MTTALVESAHLALGITIIATWIGKASLSACGVLTLRGGQESGAKKPANTSRRRNAFKRLFFLGVVVYTFKQRKRNTTHYMTQIIAVFAIIMAFVILALFKHGNNRDNEEELYKDYDED